MTQPIKSIETNDANITTNTEAIVKINQDISDIRLGVAIKDEHSNIKYTGYTDWRLKLEIYSNIDTDNSNVLKQDLLFDNSNNNTLEYVDYIHLKSIDEIQVSSNIEIINYYALQSETLIHRTYQEETYQDYISSKDNDRLLLRFTLNMLLTENIVHIPFIPGSCNLPPYSYFINYEHKGTKDDKSDGTLTYSNLYKGWNTIDWFFIYDKDYTDTRITLGFNPLVNEIFKDNIELITGFLAYNPTSSIIKTKSINYTISTINDAENEYIIKQDYASDTDYCLTKTFKFDFNDIDSNIFNSNLTFAQDTNLSFESASIKFNSITLSNIGNVQLNVDNFNLQVDTDTIYAIDDQIIKPNTSYTFTANQFTSNLVITNEFSSSEFTSKPIKIIFDNPSSTSLKYNISLEFYLEIRCVPTITGSNLLFTTKEQDKYPYLTNNKIIFTNDGSIGIGTDNTHDYSLYVNNISSKKKGIYCADDITILSDARFKTNIKTIENPIEKLMALRGVSYNRIDRDINETRFGFIAQEVQKVLPEACDGDKGIKITDIVALLVEGFKELAKNVK